MAALVSDPPKRMSPRQRESLLVRWIYKDRYEVHTHTKEQAIATLLGFGFKQIDQFQLKYEGPKKRPVPISLDFEPKAPEPQEGK